MFRTSLRVKKIALTLAATAFAATGLVIAGASPAAAADGPAIRIAPYSNAFLFVEVSGASTQSGAAVIQWPFNGGSNQVWRLRPANDFVSQIVNSGSGLCLTTDGVEGHALYQAPCTVWDGQRWDTDHIAPGNSFHQIYNSQYNLYMDVAGGSGAQGTQLIGWRSTGGRNQWFTAYGV